MAFQTLSPGTLLSPVPAVMVSCAMPGKRPNVITIAWAGTVCSDPPMLSISVRKERFSHHILLESGEFVVNLVGREQLQAGFAVAVGVTADDHVAAVEIARQIIRLCHQHDFIVLQGIAHAFAIHADGLKQQRADQQGDNHGGQQR